MRAHQIEEHAVAFRQVAERSVKEIPKKNGSLACGRAISIWYSTSRWRSYSLYSESA